MYYSRLTTRWVKLCLYETILKSRCFAMFLWDFEVFTITTYWKKQHRNSIHKYSNINITTSPSNISSLVTLNLWILSISEYLKATLHGLFWTLQLCSGPRSILLINIILFLLNKKIKLPTAGGLELETLRTELWCSTDFANRATRFFLNYHLYKHH